MPKGPEGAILQRDGKSYAIVPRTPAGLLTVDALEAITRVCRKFEVPAVKITSGQRLALIGMPEEHVEPIWDELKMEIGRAVELCVHYVQACPGTDFCKLGVTDSLGFGLELEEMFREDPFPAKVKFGVSGCPMCCAESYVRDVGVIGTKKGWTVIIGGHSGSRPRIGDILAENLERDEAMDLIRRFMTYYKEQSTKRLRVARFIEKQGLDTVKSALGI